MDYPWRASNFGFTKMRGGQTIINFNYENYKIIHLTNKPLMFRTDEKIDLNPLKLSDGGKHYLVKGGVPDLMDFIQRKGYFQKALGQISIERMNFNKLIKQEMISNVTDKFVIKAKKLYFSDFFGEISLEELAQKIKENHLNPNFF